MKRRILALLLCFAMCLSLMSVGVLAAPGNYEGFDGGTGTAANPYQIANLDQFNNLVNIINSGKPCSDTYFVLTADIGSSEAPVTTAISDYFSGHFDGADHTVTLGITDYSFDYVALFLGLDHGSIANLTIAGYVTGGYCVSGICYENYGGVIEYCINKATITSDRFAAGVSYMNGGVITNCVNSGIVNGNESIGGVCADNRATVRNCINSGEINSAGIRVGGVCADNYGSIENCLNSGSVSFENYGGGVCGYNMEKGVITNCCGIGSVTSTGYVAGGVCGPNEGDVFKCCYDKISCNSGIHFTSGPNNEAEGLTDSSKMVELLNGYTDSSTDSYPAGWRTWKLGDNGPEFAHAHRFTGDYVNEVIDDVPSHARKCSDPDCDAMGYTDDSGNPVEGYVPCVCDQEVIADAFLKEEATCVSKKLYCKSCVCGYCDKSDGSETFTDPDEEDPTGHAWKYSAVGNVLTVTCESERCTYPRPSAFLVLNAKDKVYDGHSADVSILGGDAWEALMGSGSLPNVEYYDSTGKLDAAPTNAGSYTAKITAGEATHEGTAEVTFTIQPALLVVQAENKTAAVGAEVPAFTYSILAGGSVAESDVFNERLSITLTSPDIEDEKLKTAGSYDIVPEVTGIAAGNYTFIPANGTLTVNSPNKVPIPAGATYTYDGNEKTFLTLSEGFDFDSTTAKFDANTGEFIGTDAGTYQVVLKLENDGDMWSDGTTDAKTIRFKIDPAPIIIHVKDKTATVGGTAPDLSNPAEGDDYTFLKGPATNDLGKITVALSYQDLYLNQAGSYEIQATISGDRSSNYQLFVAPGTLTVTSAGGAPSDGVPVPTPTTAFFYDGNEKTFMTIPADAGYALSSGSLTGTEAGTYPVELKLKNPGDKWSDGTTANKCFTFVITGQSAPTLAISADKNGRYFPNSTFYVFFTAQDAADHAGEITVSYPADCLSFDADSSIGLPAEYTADGGTIRLVYPNIPGDAANSFFTLAFTVKSGVSLPDTVDIRIADSRFAADEASMVSGAIPGKLVNGKDRVTVNLLDMETQIVNAAYDALNKEVKFSEYVAGYVLLNVTGKLGSYTFGGTEMYLTEMGDDGRNTFSLLIDPTADGLSYTANEDGTVSLSSASVADFLRPGDILDADHDLTLDPYDLGEKKVYDVNRTGKFDISDIRAVFNCASAMTEKFAVSDYMPIYLLSDIDGDGHADATDVSLAVQARLETVTAN